MVITKNYGYFMIDIINILVDITPMKYFNKEASKVWLTNAEVKTAQSSKLYYTLCIILFYITFFNILQQKALRLACQEPSVCVQSFS